MPKPVCRTNLYNKIVQLEVCRTFSGRGMGINGTAHYHYHYYCRQGAVRGAAISAAPASKHAELSTYSIGLMSLVYVYIYIYIIIIIIVIIIITMSQYLDFNTIAFIIMSIMITITRIVCANPVH